MSYLSREHPNLPNFKSHKLVKSLRFLLLIGAEAFFFTYLNRLKTVTN